MDRNFKGELDVRITYDCSDDWFPAYTKMEFLADFTFVDSTGLRWEANTGDEIHSVNLLRVIWKKSTNSPGSLFKEGVLNFV